MVYKTQTTIETKDEFTLKEGSVMKSGSKKPKTPMQKEAIELKVQASNLVETFDLFQSEFNKLKWMLKFLFLEYLILIIVFVWVILKDTM